MVHVFASRCLHTCRYISIGEPCLSNRGNKNSAAAHMPAILLALLAGKNAWPAAITGRVIIHDDGSYMNNAWAPHAYMYMYIHVLVPF